MRLLIEKDDGVCIEVKKIEAVSDTANLVIISTDIRLQDGVVKQLEERIEKATGKNALVLCGLNPTLYGV